MELVVLLLVPLLLLARRRGRTRIASWTAGSGVSGGTALGSSSLGLEEMVEEVEAAAAVVVDATEEPLMATLSPESHIYTR